MVCFQNKIAEIFGEAQRQVSFSVESHPQDNSGKSCEAIKDDLTKIKEQCDLQREKNWILEEQLVNYSNFLFANYNFYFILSCVGGVCSVDSPT